MSTTVKRDGTVLQDGTVIGRVSKSERETIASALLGAAGQTCWHADRPDGTRITSERGEDTRARAVRRLVADREPLTVTDIGVHDEPAIFGPPQRRYIGATVRYSGNYLRVSRYAGEPGWTVDALFLAGSSMPVWSHGDGDRTVAKHHLAEPLSGQVDALVAAALRPEVTE